MHRSRLHAFDFLIHGHLLSTLTSLQYDRKFATPSHMSFIFLLATLTWYISVNITPILAIPRGHTAQRPLLDLKKKDHNQYQRLPQHEKPLIEMPYLMSGYMYSSKTSFYLWKIALQRVHSNSFSKVKKVNFCWFWPYVVNIVFHNSCCGSL